MDQGERDAMTAHTRAFLAGWGVDMDTLAHHAPPIGDNEALAIMGSIVEGLANEQSDIDLLYLGDGGLGAKVVMSFDDAYKFAVSHDENGVEINVEQISLAALEDLARRLAASLRAIEEPQAPRGLWVERNTNRLKMMHRIEHATPLVNPHVLDHWRARIRTNELHLHVCLNHVLDLMNWQEDIVGELAAGEIESAVWIARTKYAPTLIAAMLASVGETNQHFKWHYKLVMRRREEIGAAQVDAALDFLARPAATLRANLAAEVLAITEPALARIYERHRPIRRAVLGFSRAVRYNELSAPTRWTRRTAP